ncbi:MAG: hypothetical protein B7X07_06310 [Actinobacteria bacterium 21-64-8]|nr:MAG: hypothetical protein B7X07_06310 [Actinobacteria bacterium 21-64-8]
MTRASIFPELVSGRLDDDVVAPWLVRPGSTQRGGASCDLSRRILEVPLETGATARVVRAHELVHARVSPHLEHLIRALDEVTPRALECAEEFRVNTLLARLGFGVELLSDGSERTGGAAVAGRDDWSEALCFLVAVAGTGAQREFLAGVRKVRPQWMAGLRALAKHVANLAAALPTSTLADTTILEGVPVGYARCSLVVARLLTRAMSAHPPEDAESLRTFRRSLEPGARRAPSGHFAELVFAPDTNLAPTSRRGPTRSWRPALSGTSLRYPGRLILDERRRMFAGRVRSGGGVVVIDQSGSMDLTPDDVVELLRVAPEALVVGYSHRPGDLSGVANAWLLARHGRVAPAPPAGNVGNGVDGPVLRWAVNQARQGDPIVWITDGQVTDSNDHPSAVLSQECATLVRRHHIHLARDVLEARAYLRGRRRSSSGHFARFGRVGRELFVDQVR